ncbi:MAG TPA: THUMP domain-containing protein [Gemmatimonadaceae bacterium]|nr:THUMP domain-containing protein [Gemmatimonadaceae bacterium]
MKVHNRPNQVTAFAVTAPGLEPLCAAELRGLAIRPTVDEGGVLWNGPIESIARANLWLRTASRVLVRVSEFRATAFYELELHAKRIAWDRFIAAGSSVEFRVTCRKSKLYHSDAVAQRFARAVERRVPGARIAKAKAADDDDEATDSSDHQLFVVRFLHDVCTVSVDTSGPLLHRRGYRQQIAKAPLRETLAAAALLGSGWSGDVPLVDPMCGSGTIPIEAARLARLIAPGRDRGFAFLRWPEFNQQVWTKLLDDARAGELPSSPVEIAGADRDAGAIDAARANAARAGVADDIEFNVQPISALTSAEPPGLVVSNPPYGVRVGESDELRNLYAQLGNVIRRQRSGWTLALLSADRRLEQQTRLAFEERFQTRNGGIPVRLVTAPPPSSPNP